MVSALPWTAVDRVALTDLPLSAVGIDLRLIMKNRMVAVEVDLVDKCGDKGGTAKEEAGLRKATGIFVHLMGHHLANSGGHEVGVGTTHHGSKEAQVGNRSQETAVAT
ncbi:hypothetical protein CYMTET_49683 [Cymbomonas tetramitiformis]|uniref:Uncharacterized protein n=1 Tax=Cymbomonas tetramitiformis TaxID=36881 RepID=A0AAE0BQX1_9CHLO|nr:hypothetical protein CYMTET_49683 [Cymbomonas tetramitiformis]|eukprot:gene3178-4022_t